MLIVTRSVRFFHRTNTHNSRSTRLTRRAPSAAIIGVLYLLAGNTAFAVCSDNAPLTGDTVVCTSGAPNPDTIGVQGAGADNVSVDVQAAAAVAGASGASIDLRSGADITVAGEVSNTATDAVRLGTASGPGAAVIGDIDAIKDAVTVAKAVSADRAMNAVSGIIGGVPISQPPPGLLLGGLLSSTAMNEVVVGGGLVTSSGAAGSAISSGSASSTRVMVQSNGVIDSSGEGGLVFQGSSSAGELVLRDGGSIRTSADGATAFDGGGANSAMGVQIVSGGHIVTTGNDATAVNLGAATNSVANFEAQGRPADSPVIHTSGERSGGIAFTGNDSSTLTVSITDAPTNTNSPGYLTEGNDSALIRASTPGGSSSFSVTAERASFETRGDRSSLIDLVAGSGSDILVFLEDASLRSQGSDSRLLNIQNGASSITTLVGIDVNLRSAGDGASGISVNNSGDTHSMTTFLSGADIGTSGNEAVAVTLGNDTSLSANSNQTVTVLDSTLSTTGTNSGALIVGGLGSSSASETTIKVLIASTTDDASAGIEIGALASGSAKTVSMLGVEIGTAGADSTGIDVGGITGTSSVFSYDLLDANVTTQGDDSSGWRVRKMGSSNSGTLITYDDVTVSTHGEGSAGVTLGDQDSNDASGGPVANMTRSIFGDNTNIMTKGADSAGLTINGFGAGVVNSDILLLLENHSITTEGDNSAGAVIDTVLRNATGSLATTVIDTLTIVTQGAASTGLVIGDRPDNNAGSLVVNSQLAIANIDVTTSGDNAAGVVLDPFDTNSDTSVYTLLASTVKVRTSGADADGMILGAGLGRSIAGTPLSGSFLEAELATKTEELRNRGLIGPGPITVASDVGMFGLDIASSGSRSNALVVGAGANIVVDNSTLATSGDGAHGALLLSDPTVAAANTLAYDGIITTSGAGSHGISGEGGAFDITLAASGEIETTGEGSNGIAIGHTGPEASTIRVAGTINAANDGIALAATTGAEPALRVENTGSVIGEVGIAVDAADMGSQRITNSGSITGRRGIAMSLAGGADMLEIFPGGVMGGLVDFGAGADELWLSGLMAPLVGAGSGIGPDIFGTTAIEFAEALLNGAAFFDGGADDDTLVFDSLLSLADIGSLLAMPNAGLDAFTLAFSNADDSGSVLAFRNFEFFRFGDGQVRTIASLLDDPGPSPVPAPAPLVLLLTGLLGLFVRSRVLVT
tara:strand:- start:396927 stop:400541 length:3615 start_codon:yes stop_codon:yes gene_type:complete